MESKKLGDSNFKKSEVFSSSLHVMHLLISFSVSQYMYACILSILLNVKEKSTIAY